jgi:coenzyme F420 biosynthesis associated uncharacterized protein
VNPTDSSAVGRAVDWGFAATVGARLARPAPPITDYTRAQVIDELAAASLAAEPPVREVTGLHTDGPVPQARVVDRPQWIGAAADSMREMLGAGDAGESGGGGLRHLAGRLTGQVTGAQTGAVLAFVSSGILGQFDPFAPGGGTLLLVYPNVIAVERQLRVSPSDFRLWVCLHEVTHRVQFTANPWLAEHMSGALAVLTSDGTDTDIGAVVARLAEVVRNRRNRIDNPTNDPNNDGILGLVRAVQTEPQRNALDQLLVLGTLLEGHAEHVMDAVGPAVVPSVAAIRARFDGRRGRKQPPLQRILRALLGVDAKLAQYTRGKAFVDEVVGRVGMARFNMIWDSPATLPLPDEIDSPQRWIDRVL